MRFYEFKIVEAQAGKYYTIGDSHAVAVATAGGKRWINLAIGGRPSTDKEMLANISKIPKGAVVLVSQGANDTANAMRAYMDSKGKRPLKPAQTIAANVANVVNLVKDQGATVVFLLFPNGPGRGAGLAKYYGGDYQDEVRKAIKSAIGSVKIIDLNGSPLPDGVHAGMGTYKNAAEQVMRFKEFSEPTDKTDDKKPNLDSKGDVTNPLFDPKVLELQKELKAQGADLGDYGPNKDGLDGVMGPMTRKAAAQYAAVGQKYKDVLDKPDNTSARNIDTALIQDPDFNKKLDKVAQQLGVDSNDLMAIFKQESGVNPHIQNKDTGATGLIQFMPATARKLGTTTDELKDMDAVKQLDYVYMYFKMVGVKPGMKLGDLYMAVFMPKYVGAPDDTTLGVNGAEGFSGKVYAQNKGLDRDRDGVITVADVKNSVARFA